jgi:hypothetical protein
MTTPEPTLRPPELKACPWCGSPGKLIHDTSGDYRSQWSFSVVCQDPKYWNPKSTATHDESCGMGGPDRDTEEEAIAAWNRRAAIALTPESPEQVEAVARAYDPVGWGWYDRSASDEHERTIETRRIFRETAFKKGADALTALRDMKGAVG